MATATIGIKTEWERSVKDMDPQIRDLVKLVRRGLVLRVEMAICDSDEERDELLVSYSQKTDELIAAMKALTERLNAKTSTT